MLKHAGAAQDAEARHAALRDYPTAIALLALGVLSLLYVVASLMFQAHLPSDGVLLTELSPEGFSVAISMQPLSNNLRVGDKLIALDGVPVAAWIQRSLRGAPSPVCLYAATRPCLWHKGQVLIYQVARDEMTLNVPVTLRDFPVSRLPVLRFGVYVLATVSLVICTYMLLRRPSDMATHLLFVMALCMALNLLLHNQTMTLVVPALFLVETGIRLICRALLFSAGLHLFLIFPAPKAPFVNARAGLFLLHLINPVSALLWGWMRGGEQWIQLMAVSQAVSGIGLLMLVGTVISLVHTYITAQSAVVRGQIRWMAWGVVVGLVPYILLTGLPEALWGRSVWPIEITSFFVILVPLSLALAVVRYRLLDIDTLLWHTLFHTIFFLICLGLYLIFKGIFETLILFMIGRPDEVSAVFLATLLAGAAFWTLRPALQQGADRFLFQAKVRGSRMIDLMTQELAYAIRLDQLARLLADEVPEQMGASRGWLMVLSEDKTCLEMIGAEAFSIAPGREMAQWLAQNGEPIVRSMPPDWVSQKTLDFMEQHQVELAVPLRVGEQVVGLWGLGPREGRLSYTTADTRLVRALAHQAALAVQNARLVRSMESHQQQLEDEVRNRTEVMAADRNRLNAILQNIAEALLVTDAQGQIRLANPAFENLVRRSLKKMVGHNIEEVLPLPELAQAMRAALKVPGVIHSTTMTLIDPMLSASQDMVLSEHILRASVTALQDGSAVICVLRDITHEVEVDRMKSEFISAVSHELRTPLTSILGFAKLTHRTFERTISPALSSDKDLQRAAQRVHRNLDIMVTEGERLTNLINDVLDIAALDAGTIEWEDQLCEVSVLIERAMQQYILPAAEKGLEFDRVVEERLPLLRADPERIQQVISNLISNAIKFTETGRVTVSGRRLKAGATFHDIEIPEGDAIAFAVTDTGPGISPEDIPRLFQRFSQGGDMLLDKPRGTGLGLAICQEIVLHYGGDIWATSEPGKGSTFDFILPLGGAEAQTVGGK